MSSRFCSLDTLGGTFKEVRVPANVGRLKKPARKKVEKVERERKKEREKKKRGEEEKRKERREKGKNIYIYTYI